MPRFGLCSGNNPKMKRALGRHQRTDRLLRPLEWNGSDIPQGLVWLDLLWDDPSDLDVLDTVFGFDSAAREDVLDVEQLPKYNVYEDHIFVVLHALTHDGHQVDTIEIDCFVTESVLVTVHQREVMAVDWLWENAQRYAHLSNEGGQEVFGHLIEAIGRRYLEVSAEFELRVDRMAEQALRGESTVISEVQDLRRAESTIRAILRPQRLVVSELIRKRTIVVGEDANRQLTDAFDVHNQVVGALETVRSLLTDTLDTYRGSVAERQARAATLLTVYAAIVLPMTLIAGWYGMNTENLPAASEPWGWMVVTAVMVVVGTVSWVAFRRLGLLSPPASKRRRSVNLASSALAPLRRSVMLDD
jgi:magnesium transporter